MSVEKNLLKALKAANISHADVFELLEKNGLLKEDTIIVEEAEAAVLALKKKQDEAAAAEEEEPEEAEEEDETTITDAPNKAIMAELKILKDSLKELKTKGIPLKTPSKGVQTDKDKLPENLEPNIKRNKFEAMI